MSKLALTALLLANNTSRLVGPVYLYAIDNRTMSLTRADGRDLSIDIEVIPDNTSIVLRSSGDVKAVDFRDLFASMTTGITVTERVVLRPEHWQASNYDRRFVVCDIIVDVEKLIADSGLFDRDFDGFSDYVSVNKALHRSTSLSILVEGPQHTYDRSVLFEEGKIKVSDVRRLVDLELDQRVVIFDHNSYAATYREVGIGIPFIEQKG